MLLQLLGGVEQQLMLVTADVVHAQFVKIVDGGAEPDGSGQDAGAGLELGRRLLVGRIART